MHHTEGDGLAAIQVNEPVRVCVIEIRTNTPLYPEKKSTPLTILRNPAIAHLSGKTIASSEGCLSVPNRGEIVNRDADIRVIFWDRHRSLESRITSGMETVPCQHENDHLDGKLFLDRVADNTTLTSWSNVVRHQRTDPA